MRVSGLLLIKKQLEPLFPIVGKTCIAGHEGHTLCYCMRYDNMVTGILVSMLNIRAQTRIDKHVFCFQRQHFYIELFLNGAHHLFCRLPAPSVKALVVKTNNQFTNCFSTNIEQRFWGA